MIGVSIFIGAEVQCRLQRCATSYDMIMIMVMRILHGSCRYYAVDEISQIVYRCISIAYFCRESIKVENSKSDVVTLHAMVSKRILG